MVEDFEFYTQAAAPAQISIAPQDDDTGLAPGALVPLLVSTQDAYGNPVYGVSLEITCSGGSVSAPMDDPSFGPILSIDSLGDECPLLIKSGLVAGPNSVTVSYAGSITETYSFTTSDPAAAPTVAELLQSVADNDAKIVDLMVDVTFTRTENGVATTSNGKIWRKGSMSKYQEYAPDANKMIIPPVPLDAVDVPVIERTISRDLGGDVYELTTMETSSDGTVLIDIMQIDYTKGVVLRDRTYLASVPEEYSEIVMSDFQEFPARGNAWVYRRSVTTDKTSGQVVWTIEELLENVVINSGIPDSEFQ